MRLVVGITGASGVQYGVAALELLDDCDDVESHVILSRAARRVLHIETEYEVEDVEALADVAHSPTDIAASVASGSFQFEGMLVCPCSMKTLGYIANGIADGLIPRVADVCLKERRPLVLAPRESPMAQTHLENLVAASDAGATVAPAAPGFYADPDSFDDLVTSFAARLLDQFDVDVDAVRRWGGADAVEE